MDAWRGVVRSIYVPYLRERLGLGERDISEQLILSVCEAWLEDWQGQNFLKTKERFKAAMEEMAAVVTERIEKYIRAVKPAPRKPEGIWAGCDKPGDINKAAYPAPKTRGYFLGDE